MKQLVYFCSDLHGRQTRYSSLFRLIKSEHPAAVFMAGDLLPSGMYAYTSDSECAAEFLEDYIMNGFAELKASMGASYPQVFIILGNDDGLSDEEMMLKGEQKGLWQYIHGRKARFNNFEVYGYSFVPPTPFMLKDLERYDVSRYVDPGCLPVEEGVFSIPVDKKMIPFKTMREDLDQLTRQADFERTILLFHSPPYDTFLDRAALDGLKYEHVPLDLHIGSIAIKRLIEEKQPLLSLHGHVHESASITGCWMQKIGKTIAMNAAHNGDELSLIRFDMDALDQASRELITAD